MAPDAARAGRSLDMLRSKRDFGALQGASRSRAHPLLLVRFRRNDLGHDRYGISTSRRLGKAVLRNQVRRRIREALRRMDRTPGVGWDILVVARPASATASYQDLRTALERLVAPFRTTEETRQT